VLRMRLQACSAWNLEMPIVDRIDQTPSVSDYGLKGPLVAASPAWVDEDHQLFVPDVAVAGSGQF
jgi:hypothetical protein